MSSASAPRVRSAHAVLVLLAASVLWGLSWLPLKYFAGHGVQGLGVTLVGHGSVGVLAVLWLGYRVRHWRARAGGMLVLTASGGLANLAFASALASGDVVRVMVLFYLLPAWGVLGGWLWLGERVDGQRWLALLAALSGALLILGGVRVLLQRPSAVDVLAVVSGMALALNNVWFRKLDQVAVTDKVAAMFAGCLLWASLLSLAGERALPPRVPAEILLQLVGFGLVWLLLATAGTQWGVAHLEAGRSSLLIIMELLTAVASSALLSGTRLRPIEWLGGGLIVAASVIEARRAAKT